MLVSDSKDGREETFRRGERRGTGGTEIHDEEEG